MVRVRMGCPHPNPVPLDHKISLAMQDQPWAQTPTLYLVGSERGCAKLEKSRTERSYNGLKGDAVKSS